jgi:Mg2+-importing ATPase
MPQPRVHFWDETLEASLANVQATRDGLSSAEAAKRLQQHGRNELVTVSRFAPLFELLRFFANPLVLILLVASVVSFFLGDRLDAAIIVTMVLLSVALDFYQVFQSRRAVDDLRSKVSLTAAVVRDGTERELPVAEVVPGDLVRLNAGDVVPADGRLLEAKGLYVRESALTGESIPVNKAPGDLETGGDIADAANSLFLGTSVQSGMGSMVVIATGKDTEFGEIAAHLAEKDNATEFDRGMKDFGFLLIRVTMLLVLFVFFVNVVDKRPLLSSFLFALALAVGLTPELLPVIITVTLASGAKRMARRKVIVKQLSSIENFGSIELLCSDKTGTLTVGEVTLNRTVDVRGEASEEVAKAVFLNSSFETGVKSPLDDAVLAAEHPAVEACEKLDEVPFDFERRRSSVVLRIEGGTLLIAKGAAEDLLKVCSQVLVDGKRLPLDDDWRGTAEEMQRSLGKEGLRVLGVATREVEQQAGYSVADERDLVFLGFAAFLDPAKQGVRKTLQALKHDGISIVVMTGDNEYVSAKIAHDVGLPYKVVVRGAEVDAMTDDALAVKAEKGAIFARVSPEQKNRIINALKKRGRVVGYLGDGINDAPSLHTADIGISVMNAVDVAKDAANIILLEKDLAVLHEGVIEGRRSFANIMKYIIMGTSSNFGNMFSMAGASLFLPFLPMLPTQILLNNLLYDASQVAIPSDNVDAELLHKPKRWRMQFIRQFMVIIGPISSIYDFLTFAVLLLVFHANEQLFHTGWFVESLATQALVVFVIRTSGNPLRSRPSRRLALTVLAAVAVGFVLPYTPLAKPLGFVPLPIGLIAVIVGFAATYLLLVQFVKQWFYRKHELI